MAANRDWQWDNSVGLQIGIREQGTTTAIELHGECDLAAQPTLRHAIATVLDREPESVVLDLSGLEFIDSSGLQVTVELARRAAVQNIRLVIIRGPRAVQRVFELTGLADRLPLIDEEPSGSRVAGPDGAPPRIPPQSGRSAVPSACSGARDSSVAGVERLVRSTS